MKEKRIPKREWVKTAAIIFLAVMLILTFFSNTIMNYSLPEVSAQYAFPGSIQSIVRGSGVVEPNQLYEIQIQETRQIKAVAVRNGDMVDAGQTLFYLEETESDELKNAQALLDNLTLEYLRTLITSEAGSAEIKNLQRDLREARERRDGAVSEKAAHDEAKANARAAAKEAQRIYDAAAKKVAEKEAEIADLLIPGGDTVYFTQQEQRDVLQLRAEYEAAEAALENCKAALGDARAAFAEIEGRTLEAEREYNQVFDKYEEAQAKQNQAQNKYDLAVEKQAEIENTMEKPFHAAQAEVVALERSLETLMTSYKYLRQNYNAATGHGVIATYYLYYQEKKADYITAKSSLETAKARPPSGLSQQEYEQLITNLEQAFAAAYEAQKSAFDTYQSALLNETSILNDYDKQIAQSDVEIRYKEADLEEARDLLKKLSGIQEKLEIAQAEVLSARSALNAEKSKTNVFKAEAGTEQAKVNSLKNQQQTAQKAVDKANSDLENAKDDYEKKRSALLAILKSEDKVVKEAELAQLKMQLDTLSVALDAARDFQMEVESKPVLSVEEANEAVKTIERNLENAVTSYENQSDLTDLELQAKKREMEKQKQIVEKLSEWTSESEIITKYAGVISAMNVVAGDSTTPGVALAAVEVAEKGYTVSFSVTNEQSRTLRVGEPAEIRNIWTYGSSATLSAIKNDPSNPGRSKILTFDILGDVFPGQTLNISVGNQSSFYDMIVPNSALREDSNGKYLLVVKAKSSPLGNRYLAVREDVQILATDETSSAVQGALYGNEFVITGATKPIEPGKQVRLVES